MKIKIAAICAILTVSMVPGEAADSPSVAINSQGPPAWFLAHIDFLVKGRWITDNSQHKFEDD